jgi:EmrB/QacA subfamily drug resistance transporter
MGERMSSQRAGANELMVLLVAILGTGMVYLDQTALNVALPSIQRDLNADIGGLQWMVDIYMLTLAVLLLIGGALGDKYGRVRVFIIGMVVFVAASIAAGAAGSLGFLVVARGLQGVGGALLIPGGLAIVNATVAPERRGRVLGTWGTFSPLITLSGPLLGGWLVDNLSWRAVFYLNVPLGLLATYIAARHVPENRDENANRQLDWAGVITLMLGLGALLFGLIEGGHLGWGHPLVLGSLMGGGLGLVVFVWVEARSPAPLLPLHLLRVRTFSGINLVTLIHYIALGSVFFFLTLNFQQAQGFSAFRAGLAQMPVTLLVITMARPMGALTDRIGAVPLLTTGILLNGLGCLLLMRPGLNANYWTTYFPAQIVYGVGLGLLIVPLTTVAMSALPDRYSGIASGLNNAVSRIAQMLAVAVFGLLMLTGFRQGLAERTAGLALPEAARGQLMAEARNLGATQPPAGLDAAAAEAVRTAIRLAFLDGFRQLMLVSAVLSGVSAATTLALVRSRPGQAAHQAATVPQPGD